MHELHFLNSKEKREIIKSLSGTYGFSGALEGALLISQKEKRIYLLSGAELLPDQADKELRIDKAGLYIGKILSNGILLNIEGSQLIGPHSGKHILELDDDHLELFVKGQDFDLSENEIKSAARDEENDGTEESSEAGVSGIFIVKYKDDFLSCSIIKNGKLQNNLSKSRWVKNLNR
jgi:NOL1/NOP2/fmu family ribosome biogenesis protein